MEINWGWVFVYMLGFTVFLCVYAANRTYEKEKTEFITIDEFEIQYKGDIVALMSLSNFGKPREYDDCRAILYGIYCANPGREREAIDRCISEAAEAWRK